MSRRPQTIGEPAAPASLPALEPLLGQLAAADAGAPADHPDPGRLIAYHEGRLGAADERALQDHLAACRACSAALLDLDAFESAAAEGAETAPADLATAAAWRGLAPRLDGVRGGEPPSGAARTRERRRTARRPLPPWLRAAAAALLVALPLTGLLIHSRRQVGELHRALAAPQTGVPILYLDSTTRDEGFDAATLDLPQEDGFFLLAVTPAAGVPGERYRVEILDQEGRLVWRDDGVPLSDHGTLRLGFTRRSLPPGRYRIEVTGGEATAPPTAFDFVLRGPA